MSQGIESNSTNAVASPSMLEEEVQVNSVSEFIEKIVQLDKKEGTEIFYRGHANRDWKLLPSIFRTPNGVEKEHLNGVEKEHLLFRDMVAHEPQSFSECKSTLDYLVQMQHYGLPTRLLDMTTNPLVALYFACEQAGDDLDAGILSGMTAGHQAITDILQSTKSIFETNPRCIPKVAESIRKLVGTLVEDNAKTDSEYLVDLMLKSDIQNKGEAMALLGAIISLVDPNAISMVAAIAGAIAGAGSPGVATRLGASLLTGIMPATMPNTDPTIRSVTDALLNETTLIIAYEFAVTLAAKLAAQSGAELGAKARAKDGIVYLFSIPEDKVKHYDSDTVSVLANLAKCKISEQCSACLSVEDFNEQPDIKFLLHQIKGEKPHFLPRIQPLDLSNLFFVKAKNGNQRIANQMGAFLIFGLGVKQEKVGDDTPLDLSNLFFVKAKNGNQRIANQMRAFLIFGLGVKQVKVGDDTGETSLLTKSKHMEVPVEWIKKKLIIPKDKKPDILKELALLGITESYIYPGMEQYAKELKKRYGL